MSAVKALRKFGEILRAWIGLRAGRSSMKKRSVGRAVGWRPSGRKEASSRRRERRFVWALVSCMASCFGAFIACGAEPEDWPLVRIEARFFHATRTQARKAFGSLIDKDGAVSGSAPEESGKALQTLVRLKADLFSSPNLVARSGQSALVEAVREMRYPTQFDPTKEKSEGLVPTVFEMRNVGVTLEVKAIVEGDQINLSVSPKVVSFLGFINYSSHPAGKAAKGPHSAIQALEQRTSYGEIFQPVLETLQMTTDRRVKSGETIILGRLGLGVAAGQFAPDSPWTFVFITARILPARNAESNRNVPPHE